MKVKRRTRLINTSPTLWPVYDLSVPGLQNFCLGNGAVVHNSNDVADALCGVVYGLTTRAEIWALHGVSYEQYQQNQPESEEEEI